MNQRVVLEITRRCNLSCRDCYREHDQIAEVDLPLGQAKAVLDWAAKQTPPAEVSLFFDGEPFLHPNLLEIVHHANSLKVPYIVSTNGTIWDDAVIQSMLRGFCRLICVSIDGWNRKVVRYYRGTDRAIEFLSDLIHAKRRLSSPTQLAASYFWTTQPYFDMQKFVRTWLDEGADMAIVRRNLPDVSEPVPAGDSATCLYRDMLVVKADSTIRLCERRPGAPKLFDLESHLSKLSSVCPTDAGNHSFCASCAQRFVGLGFEGVVYEKTDLGHDRPLHIGMDYFNTIYSKTPPTRGLLRDLARRR